MAVLLESVLTSDFSFRNVKHCLEGKGCLILHKRGEGRRRRGLTQIITHGVLMDIVAGGCVLPWSSLETATNFENWKLYE